LNGGNLRRVCAEHLQKKLTIGSGRKTVLNAGKDTHENSREAPGRSLSYGSMNSGACPKEGDALQKSRDGTVPQKKKEKGPGRELLGRKKKGRTKKGRRARPTKFDNRPENIRHSPKHDASRKRNPPCGIWRQTAPEKRKAWPARWKSARNAPRGFRRQRKTLHPGPKNGLTTPRFLGAKKTFPLGWRDLSRARAPKRTHDGRVKGTERYSREPRLIRNRKLRSHGSA